MKKILSLALVATLGMSLVGCNDKADKNAPVADSASQVLGTVNGTGLASELQMLAQQDSTFKLDKEAVLEGIQTILKADTSDRSLMIGMEVGMQLLKMQQDIKAQAGFNLNQKSFFKKFKEAFMADSIMSQEKLYDMQVNMQSLLGRAREEALENDPKAVENKKAGEAFINKKKADKSYKTTKSGLVYKVLKEGNGDKFTATDVIMVNYEGKHVDGKVFDSSNGKPVAMQSQGVIPGFAEMLQLMKPGMKVEVIIPSNLAYGTQGARGAIGPNETLVFTLETVGLRVVEAPQGGQVPVTAAPTDLSPEQMQQLQQMMQQQGR